MAIENVSRIPAVGAIYIVVGIVDWYSIALLGVGMTHEQPPLITVP